MHVGRFGHLGRHDGLGRLERFGSIRRIRAFDRPLAEGDGGFGGRGCGICVHRIARTGVGGLDSLFGRILIELLFRGLPYGGNPILAGLALRSDLPGIEPAADGGRGHGAGGTGSVGAFDGFGRFVGFLCVGHFGRFAELGACNNFIGNFGFDLHPRVLAHGPIRSLKPFVVRFTETLQKFLCGLFRKGVVLRNPQPGEVDRFNEFRALGKRQRLGHRAAEKHHRRNHRVPQVPLAFDAFFLGDSGQRLTPCIKPRELSQLGNDIAPVGRKTPYLFPRRTRTSEISCL